jgi:uncharacterized protein (TIGR02217 family)
MAFHDVQFPPDIAVGAVGGPGYHTSVVTLASGREKRNIDWSDARCVWDVAHGLKTQDQLDRLLAFFRARQGKAHAFRFKDWSDFVLGRQTIASGDGTTKAFQLLKTYADAAGYQAVRRVTRPVFGTVRVWVGGAERHDTVIDHATGIVSFATAPGSGMSVEAQCQFDVPARFDTDQMQVTIEDYGTYSWGQIPVVEVKE